MDDKCQYCGGEWEYEQETVHNGIGLEVVAAWSIPCCERSEIHELMKINGEEPTKAKVWAEWKRRTLKSNWKLTTVHYYPAHEEGIPF